MIRALGLLALLALAVPAFAGSELPLKAVYEQSTDPLTTEKAWVIAPEELNSHRLVWYLSRHVELSGLRASGEGGNFRPSADALYSKAVAYIRPSDDPFYGAIEDFPCTKIPDARFATYEGTRRTADLAARRWEELLSREKFKLSVLLSHVKGEFSENAIQDSNAVLARWLDEVLKTWETKTLPEIRFEEWRDYERAAAAQGVCKGEGRNGRSPRSWTELMEAPRVEDTPKIIAHLPAKRWGGLYSVLVTMSISGKDVVGKFLIDSGAPNSVISPTFLSNQGAFPSWIEVPKAKPQRITWTGGSGVGTPAYVAQVKVSGITLPIHDFFIHDTDFFGPPESFATCCDGILGSDFLRQYAVEFKPGKTAEVNLYAREGFHLPKRTPWVEVSINKRHEIISDCSAYPQKGGTEVLRGVIWQTGNEDALEFNRSVSAREKAIPFWTLSCNGERMADHIRISMKDQEMTGTAPLDAGMELLGRGGFTFDLGHGRLWFNPNGLFLPIVQNHSGLNLEYVYIDGDRFLKVIGIRRKSPAEALEKGGLRQGMTILSLGSKSVDDMDTWEVEQRLSGIYGTEVAVEWKTGKKSSKIVPLRLPPIAP